MKEERPNIYPFLSMNRGESFVIPSSHKSTFKGVKGSIELMNQVCNYPTKRFYSARTDDGGLTIWRVK